MAKQKRNQEQRENIYQQRVEQKLRLLQQFPNAIVYEFSNPTIRENFRVPVRILELANNAFREFWGFYITDEDIDKLDSIIKEVEEKAKNVIELADKYGAELKDFNYDRLKNMRKIEKERIIKNSRVTTELIISQNETFDYIHEAILLIDQYDLAIKQNRSKEEAQQWIKAVREFMETIKKAESEIIKLTAEKLDPRYLGRYKALRNNVVRYLKAIKDVEETETPALTQPQQSEPTPVDNSEMKTI